MSDHGDDIEMQLHHRLRLTTGAIGSLMSSRAPGQRCDKAFRGVLREAVQRRDSAQHDLDRYLSTRRLGLLPSRAVC